LYLNHKKNTCCLRIFYTFPGNAQIVSKVAAKTIWTRLTVITLENKTIKKPETPFAKYYCFNSSSERKIKNIQIPYEMYGLWKKRQKTIGFLFVEGSMLDFYSTTVKLYLTWTFNVYSFPSFFFFFNNIMLFSNALQKYFNN
jgi:hypothetical protein